MHLWAMKTADTPCESRHAYKGSKPMRRVSPGPEAAHRGPPAGPDNWGHACDPGKEPDPQRRSSPGMGRPSSTAPGRVSESVAAVPADTLAGRRAYEKILNKKQ